MTATPLMMENPDDLLNLLLLLRPPTLNWTAQADLMNLAGDLRRMKGVATVKGNPHDDAVKWARGTTTDTQVSKDENDAGRKKLVEVLIAQLQRHILTRAVRRTNSSVDWQGNRLNSTLPTNTFITLSVDVTESEAKESYKSMDGEVKQTFFDRATHGAFFNAARSKLAFPSAKKFDFKTYGLEQLNSDSATKLKTTIEILTRVVTRGVETMVPGEMVGSQNRIEPTSSLGLPDVRTNYEVKPLVPAEVVSGEKAIIYTTLAKPHKWLEKVLKLLGFGVEVINGTKSGRERTRAINAFKNDPNVHVLIMSPVGQQGLNLTCARVIILYDANWSAVLTAQIIGRIYRRGQLFTTFVFQLMAANSVDTLLVSNGLGKRELLGSFLKIERNESRMRLMAGTATDEEVAKLEQATTASEEALKEVSTVLKNPRFSTAKAMQARHKANEPTAPKTKKPRLSAKAKGKRKAEESDDEPEEQSVVKKPRISGKKVKSPANVEDSDEGETESGRAKAGSSKKSNNKAPASKLVVETPSASPQAGPSSISTSAPILTDVEPPSQARFNSGVLPTSSQLQAGPSSISTSAPTPANSDVHPTSSQLRSLPPPFTSPETIPQENISHNVPVLGDPTKPLGWANNPDGTLKDPSTMTFVDSPSQENIELPLSFDDDTPGAVVNTGFDDTDVADEPPRGTSEQTHDFETGDSSVSVFRPQFRPSQSQHEFRHPCNHLRTKHVEVEVENVLAYIISKVAASQVPQVLNPVKITGPGGAVVLEYSPIHEALIRAKIPNWIEKERPPYVDAEWEKTWKETQEKIQQRLLTLEGRGAVEDFDYIEAELDVVLAASRKGNWSGVGDRLILELLTEHNVSTRQIDTDAEFYVESKDDDSGNGVVRPEWITWWKNGLKWLLRSHEDVNANANRIDPNATENRQQLIEERWKRLTPRAQKIEYAQMLVCWLSGIVEKKTGVIMDFAEAAEPDGDQLVFIAALLVHMSDTQFSPLEGIVHTLPVDSRTMGCCAWCCFV
ncbi:hypothetical protein AAF712_008565 [Marasmius tenuissimus]|uniref:Helicase C-terminal domain-containing protein n=1 Tax=Marasmius tenuissimus TaxID=585030 RepID=A0ABR2ZTV8_9AGAR